MRSMEMSPPVMARVAGLLYLLIIVCGIFSEAAVRSVLVVAGDAAATAQNISASAGLFRLGFLADIIMLLCDVAIAVLFYLLLRPVSRTLAMAAAAFRLLQAGVLAVNMLNYYAAMLLLSGSIYAGAFEPDVLHALAMLFLQLHAHGYDLALLFFALSNLFLGWLLVRAQAFPSLLGYGLWGAALVYLIGSLGRFLVPEYHAWLMPAYIIPLVAELSLCLWLLVKGVRVGSQDKLLS